MLLEQEHIVCTNVGINTEICDMARLFFIFVLTFYFNISFSFEGDLPPIYISPNPTTEDVFFHSGNPEIIKLDKRNINLSIGEILRNKSSLTLSQSGGIAGMNQLRMRGGEANHVLVLIDGIEVNDPASGSEYDFSHLYSHNFKNIEILRGSYSNVHGPDAISGVINIKTKNKSGANILTGSNNTHIKNFSLSGENKFFQYGIDINFLDSSGTDTSGSSGDRNRYENDSFRVNLKSINHNFSIFYFDIYKQNDRDASGNLVDNENATTDVNQLYSQYVYKNKISKRISFKQGFQYTTNKNLDFSPSNGVWETVTQSEKFKTFFNTKINFIDFFSVQMPPSLSFSAEYEKINFTQLVLDRSYGNGNQNQDEYSGSFVSELIFPYRNTQFEISLRRTINQKFDNNNTHRVGFTYKLENGKVFINHATAFKNPTFTERFGYYPGTFNGNENLKPESIKQVEVGYFKRMLRNKLSISQTYYNMKLRDEINGFTSDGNGGYTALNIANNSYRKGLETQIQMLVNKRSKITFKHDYVDSTQYDATAKKQISEVRRPKNIYNLIYENTLSNYLHLNTNIFYSSKVKDTNFSSWPYKAVFLGDYVLVNAKLNWNLDMNNKISFMLNNIFNRKYSEVYGYNNPGFEFNINYLKDF